MNIHDRVCNTRLTFSLERGENPERLYLGQEEAKALTMYIFNQSHGLMLVNLNRRDEHRCSYMGMKVFVVTDTNHLECGS